MPFPCLKQMSSPIRKPPLPKHVWNRLRRGYVATFGFPLCCYDSAGALVWRGRGLPGELPDGGDLVRLARETLRWGETAIEICQDGSSLMWAVPIMENQELRGGLAVVGAPLEPPEGEESNHCRRLHAASVGLLISAVEHNLASGELLKQRRDDAGWERERAEAIHWSKAVRYDSVREIYLNEEPALLAAIKRGEKHLARERINRVLVSIYHIARDRPELLKSFAMELVVMMSRAAVESGADPSLVLGLNYESLVSLAQIDNEEDLARWLCHMLEQAMNAIRDHAVYPNTVLLGKALAYIDEHLDEDLRRGKVARAAGLSASHFSRLLKEKTGRNFTEVLQEARINRARELFQRTAKSVVQVAIECGFCDQSYFTKIFRKHVGQTPRAYCQNRRRSV